VHAPRSLLHGKATLLERAFNRIQGWQTRSAVAISNHRTSRGPIGRHGCYRDSTHFTSNTQQRHHLCASRHRRPTEH